MVKYEGKYSYLIYSHSYFQDWITQKQQYKKEKRKRKTTKSAIKQATWDTTHTHGKRKKGRDSTQTCQLQESTPKHKFVDQLIDWHRLVI